MKTRGFVLLDLMTSITIIGILTSVAAPSYRTYVERAKLSSCIDRIRDLRRAAVEYRAHNDLSLFASGTQYWQTYNGGAQDPEYVYCSNADEMHGVTGLGRDGSARAGGATAFTIACTHDHGRAAAYVFTSNVVPNVIVVAAIGGSVSPGADCSSSVWGTGGSDPGGGAGGSGGGATGSGGSAGGGGGSGDDDTTASGGTGGGASGFGDGTNPGEGAEHSKSGNEGTGNPNQSGH
jgi:Tfp pilus assembly major pilin PilA